MLGQVEQLTLIFFVLKKACSGEEGGKCFLTNERNLAATFVLMLVCCAERGGFELDCGGSGGVLSDRKDKKIIKERGNVTNLIIKKFCLQFFCAFL